MQLHPMKLLTVVAEEVLRDPIVRKMQELGARGCSYHSTQGVGLHEVRHNDVFSANVQLKVVCTKEVGEAILLHLADHYFGKYAIVAWLGDVEVVRPQHFYRKSQ